MKKLRFFTVESVCLRTRRIHYSNILAVSVRHALTSEILYFGEPHFRILRAYPKQDLSKQADKE